MALGPRDWYRPSKHEYQTTDEIETLHAEAKEIILMGDVSCNDLDMEGKSRILVSLHNMYDAYQLKQLIEFLARPTLSSQTLIDHFATNQSKFITESGVFTTRFSDHDVFGIDKISTRINREPKVVKTRQLKNYNPEKFKQNLEQVNWKNILKLSDVNEMSLEWEKQFISILEWNAHHTESVKPETLTHPIQTKMSGTKCFFETYIRSDSTNVRATKTGSNSSSSETLLTERNQKRNVNICQKS